MTGQASSDEHCKQTMQFVWRTEFRLLISIFIGQTRSQFLQPIHVPGALLREKRLILEINPKTAPNGQRYLHQGRSIHKDANTTKVNMIKALMATSPVQK